MNSKKHYTYKQEYNNLVNVLTTKVEVCQSSIISGEEIFVEVSALWDTGATYSVITPALAQKLNLLPIDKATVCGVNSCNTVNVYWVDIALPNKVLFEDIAITESDFVGADILIGMDIIQKGDFIISNSNGKTSFSFCMPPLDKQVDFDYLIDQKKSIG